VAGNYLLAARQVKSSLRPPQEFSAKIAQKRVRTSRLAEKNGRLSAFVAHEL
jgi:hypothetical protein